MLDMERTEQCIIRPINSDADLGVGRRSVQGRDIHPSASVITGNRLMAGGAVASLGPVPRPNTLRVPTATDAPIRPAETIVPVARTLTSTELTSASASNRCLPLA